MSETTSESVESRPEESSSPAASTEGSEQAVLSKPGVHDVKKPIYDEPESSYSPGSNYYSPAPVLEGEPPTSDELKEAKETFVKQDLFRSQVPADAEKKVSYAPQLFGAAPEAPVIYGEEDDAEFLPGDVPEESETEETETADSGTSESGITSESEETEPSEPVVEEEEQTPPEEEPRPSGPFA